MTTRSTRSPRRRTVIALAVVLAVLAGFIVRLVDIQVVNADTHIADSHEGGARRVAHAVRDARRDRRRDRSAAGRQHPALRRRARPEERRTGHPRERRRGARRGAVAEGRRRDRRRHGADLRGDPEDRRRRARRRPRLAVRLPQARAHDRAVPRPRRHRRPVPHIRRAPVRGRIRTARSPATSSASWGSTASRWPASRRARTTACWPRTARSRSRRARTASSFPAPRSSSPRWTAARSS